MNSALPRQILGWLIMAPRLIETCNLSMDDFPAGRHRQTFEVISAMWENDHPEEIPLAILSERLGGDGAATFTGALLDGLQKPTAEIFSTVVRHMKRCAISEKIVTAAGELGRVHLKTGAFDDKGFSELRRLVAEQDELEYPAVNLNPLSAVESKDILWLWPGRIPLGMLSILAGSAGQGKSTLALAIAARLSRGETLPDSGGAVLGCDSLILAAEDPIAQAVRPRAEANGADLSRTFFLEAEDLNVIEIFVRLRQALAANPKIKFVVVDPLNAFLKAGTDYFRDPDVRRALLRPLSVIAEESGAAVLGICHLNKRTDESGALNRIGGSVAYGAAARSVLALGLDPDNPERRLLAPAKCNYAKMPGTIAFAIGDGGRIEFEPNVVDIGADEILQRRDPDRAAEGDFSSEWLIDQLKAGPVELQALLKDAKKESISRPTLFRVRKKIGVISRVSGFGQFKVSTWELPK